MFQFVYTHPVIWQSSTTQSRPATSLSQIVIYHCPYCQRTSLPSWKSYLIESKPPNPNVFHSNAKSVHDQVQDLAYIFINVLCDHHLLRFSLHCRERSGTAFPRIPFSICSRLAAASERDPPSSWKAEKKPIFSENSCKQITWASVHRTFHFYSSWRCRQLRSMLSWEPSTLISSAMTVASLNSSPPPPRLSNSCVSL